MRGYFFAFGCGALVVGLLWWFTSGPNPVLESQLQTLQAQVAAHDREIATRDTLEARQILAAVSDHQALADARARGDSARRALRALQAGLPPHAPTEVAGVPPTSPGPPQVAGDPSGALLGACEVALAADSVTLAIADKVIGDLEGRLARKDTTIAELRADRDKALALAGKAVASTQRPSALRYIVQGIPLLATGYVIARALR
jgi:hypothetical protein